MTDAELLFNGVNRLQAGGWFQLDARERVLEDWLWAKTESLKAAPQFNQITGRQITDTARVVQPIANGGTAEETDQEIQP